MEKVKDILSNIRERFSNPLLFSFLCSWLVINWKISVGLLWYDPTQLEKHGYVSFFDLIEHNLNTNDSIYKPLIFAIAYTILAPVLKVFIKAFYSWTSKWGETWNLRIIDGGKISISKFLKLREEYHNNISQLEKVIEGESEYVEQNEELSRKLNDMQIELNRSKKEYIDLEERIREFNDVQFLDGIWINTYEIHQGSKGTEEVAINNGRYSIVTKFDVHEQKFDIRDFWYDKKRKKIFFVKELTMDEKRKRPESEHYLINRLDFKGSGLLVGYENGTTKIEYRRKN